MRPADLKLIIYTQITNTKKKSEKPNFDLGPKIEDLNTIVEQF